MGALYCSKYMQKKGIKQFYGTKYDANSPSFWNNIELPNKADKEYVCIGVKASNYFMPEETKSVAGPGGGGWILMDMTLAVKTREEKVWSVDDKGYARVYAIGACNYGCVVEKGTEAFNGPLPPIPKISYPGGEQACSLPHWGQMMCASWLVPIGSRIQATWSCGEARVQCKRRSLRHPRSTSVHSV